MPYSPTKTLITPEELYLGEFECLNSIGQNARAIGIGEGAHFVLEFSLARASLIHYFVEVHSFNSIGLECNAIQGQQISEWLNSSTNEKKLEDVSNPLTFAVYGSLLIWLKSYLRETGRKLDVITFLQKQSLSQLSRL